MQTQGITCPATRRGTATLTSNNNNNNIMTLTQPPPGWLNAMILGDSKLEQ